MGRKTSLSPQQGRPLRLAGLAASVGRALGLRVHRGWTRGGGVLPPPGPGASPQNDERMEVGEVLAGKAVSVRRPGGWPEWPCLPEEGIGPGGPSFSWCVPTSDNCIFTENRVF